MTEVLSATETRPDDLDLPDVPQPRTDGYEQYMNRSPLARSLSCTRVTVGAWDGYGVRILTNEVDGYASIHFRVPEALPTPWVEQLAALVVQRVPYTERDREWDLVSGPTSDQRCWSGFVDSVLAAVNFARAAVESAVWAHARGEDWSWSWAAPGRDETKYELWGDGHPNSYDPDYDYETRWQEDNARGMGPVPDDVEF